MATLEKSEVDFPVHKSEESSVVNYINSPSPIKQVEYTVAQIFTPPNFTSAKSVFDRPHFGSHNDTRFLGRHPNDSELPKPEFSHVRNEDGAKERIPNLVKLSDLCPNNLGGFIPVISSGVCTNELSYENMKLTNYSPKKMKYDRSVSESDVVRCDVINQELHEICLHEQNKESPECSWEKLISNEENVLSDAPDMEKQCEGQDQNSSDSAALAFISNILDLELDDINDLKKTQHEMHGSVAQSGSQEMNESHQTLEVPFSGNDPSLEVDDNGENCMQTDEQNQHIIGRRLVFETVGGHKRQAPGSISMIFPRSNSESNSSGKRMASFKHIGLHLNTLATGSNIVKLLKHESSGNQLATMTSSFNCSAYAQEVQDESMSWKSLESEFSSNENEIMFKDEDFNHSSPDRKRQRLEQDRQNQSCKHCNCKKSKCLKLYCECFAAGLYCLEPCSCKYCFNKSVHEEIVMKTRKQIETRDPLAFAPKVVRKTPNSEYGDDDSNKTPASARHKRGCNCRKSSCLKKYCECFQGGVGCSIGCRCEGCKNSFGRKDGMDATEIEDANTEACQVNEVKTCSTNNAVQQAEVRQQDVNIPTPSSIISRTSLPFSSCGKSLQFSAFNGPNLGASSALMSRLKHEKHLQPSQEETPEILAHRSLPISAVKSIYPSLKRISPPHGKAFKKFILKSIPSFPSLTSHSHELTSDPQEQ